LRRARHERCTLRPGKYGGTGLNCVSYPHHANNLLVRPTDRIARVVEAVGKTVAEDIKDVARGFTHAYFNAAVEPAFSSRTDEALARIAESHLAVALAFKTGEPSVRATSCNGDGESMIEIVNNDMPHLVDTMNLVLHRNGLRPASLHHPVLHVVRDSAGILREVVAAASGASRPESYIRVELEQRRSDQALAVVASDLLRAFDMLRTVLADSILANETRLALVQRLDSGNNAEERAFLSWLDASKFMLLGVANYAVTNGTFVPAPASGIGLLGAKGAIAAECLIPERLPEPGCGTGWTVEYQKASVNSPILSGALLDCICVTRRGADEQVCEEWRLVGYLSSEIQYSSPFYIPLLRGSLTALVAAIGAATDSHAARTLTEIINRYPREDLLSESILGTLPDNIATIMALYDRPRVAMIVRPDIYHRFLVCHVFVPRRSFARETAERVAAILSDAIGELVTDVACQVNESPLVRLSATARVDTEKIAHYSPGKIEACLKSAICSWEEEVEERILKAFGPIDGPPIHSHWIKRVHVGYKDAVTASEAGDDFAVLERLSKEGAIGARFVRGQGEGQTKVALKLYGCRTHLPVSQSLPVLENFGLRIEDHQSFGFGEEDGTRVWIQVFDLSQSTAEELGGLENWRRIENAIRATLAGEAEADEFCSLVVKVGLSERETNVFRVYNRYLKQIGFPLVGSGVASSLGRNVHLAFALFQLFAARFDPDLGADRDHVAAKRLEAIQESLAAVANGEDDRVLRKYLMLIEATLRTNFFQQDANGLAKPYLSIKLDSLLIEDLPAPRARYEIFVYSPRMEGIHLRGGKVARGGIRWSGRLEDFRTEIHGLFKAQMVKNVVIVPQGAKGGFVVKRPPSGTDFAVLRHEAIECYKTLIRGLLDITDNMVNNRVVPSPRVVRRDGDDTYLVVAADKGTATFSDIANGVAAEYNFWLDDAFASGGAAGYDHKKMGITARGAWESVKRHFWEIGVDVQSQDFTVVGIGDMSGDVFGNGMLQSPCIRLLGAFDHRHIFIDPDPDAATSFKERRRLFDLSNSSWNDYDQKLLSLGGGIFDRSAKSVAVSKRVQDLLGLAAATSTPDALIKALLRLDADLLWLGGIGTYIKAASESHEAVGDRACDTVRIDARQLRCRVIGEGANLGITQRGRVDYALRGGRINTDAIDNAGGVNCSDHEVNIKILLNKVMREGGISRDERDSLLKSMTDEVAELVLRDNYLQAQALSVGLACAPQSLDRHQRLIRRFERAGQLDREVIGLPDDEAIAARHVAGGGLTRSELSVLLAHTKISLFAEIIASDLPDDPLFIADLVEYFPGPLRNRFRDAIAQHPLRREITATMVVNSMVNRVGSGFVDEMQARTACSDAAVARAYAIVVDVFCLSDFWAQVESLDGTVPSEVQMSMMLQSRLLTEVATLWMLRNIGELADVSSVAARFRYAVRRLLNSVDSLLDPVGQADFADRLKSICASGIPEGLAKSAAALQELQAALDIALLSEVAGHNVDRVGRLYFATRARLGIPTLMAASGKIPQRDAWETQAYRGVLDVLTTSLRAIVAELINPDTDEGEADDRDSISRCLERVASGREDLDGVIADLGRGATPSLAMVVVASQEIAALAQGL